ncbi:hypothetical protein QJS66_04100 [Kocuria rhizophila]|nr:hypothetical protein QJS66_04100 [Kocuria rhizophila]
MIDAVADHPNWGARPGAEQYRGRIQRAAAHEGALDLGRDVPARPPELRAARRRFAGGPGDHPTSSGDVLGWDEAERARQVISTSGCAAPRGPPPCRRTTRTPPAAARGRGRPVPAAGQKKISGRDSAGPRWPNGGCCG